MPNSMLRSAANNRNPSAMTEPRLIVISAPSGCGKTRLIEALLAHTDRAVLSISHTTREPRTTETDGTDYHFVNVETFEQMVAEGAFVEHATIFGNQYGTAAVSLEAQLAAGHDVVLEIDWQGARNVRAQYAGQTLSIFILPPSLAELEKRLRLRATDTEEVIARRLAQARDDIAHCSEYDLCLVNDDFAEAVDTLCAMVADGERFKDADARPCTERVSDFSN